MRIPTNMTIREEVKAAGKEFCRDLSKRRKNGTRFGLSELADELLAEYLSRTKRPDGTPYFTGTAGLAKSAVGD